MFNVEMIGQTPILMHFDNIEAQDQMHARGKSGGKAGDDRTPPDTWKTYLYHDGEHIVMPSQNVLAALLKVGSSISIGGKKTLKSASQGVIFDDVYLPFLVGETKAAHKIEWSAVQAVDGTFDEQRQAVRAFGFEIQVSPVRVNGKRHIRTRPMFASWRIDADFSIADPDLTLPRLKELFALAGLKSGLGDWRPGSPSKPGPYGRFSATVSEY